ncbi:nucleotide-binding universal stress UspA family protein [Streptomyces sp. TLI_235]|nr:universal stress protein [Streptomyces sp. TLI_235]PBC76224.1 nucleotide-binding universal stress UspA family protein [Streptomyces sp. TLI_235]
MTSAVGSHQIVVGVDAENPASPALAWAADEAVRRGLPLRLVHAVPPSSRDARGFDEGQYRTAMHEAGEAALGEARLAVEERYSGLDVSIVLADGQPGQVLCRRAANAEMIVLGSRGLSRVEELLSTYSVTVPVTAQASCPVVVVRGVEHVVQDPPYLVVGVDGSPGSVAAIDHAFDAAARRGAELRAVWVWQAPTILPIDKATAVREIQRQLHAATAGRTALYPDVRLTHEVVTGHPVEQLAAASEHALALVVGRRGRGGFTGLRLGSVPHGLLHRALCPIVTVPADTE